MLQYFLYMVECLDFTKTRVGIISCVNSPVGHVYPKEMIFLVDVFACIVAYSYVRIRYYTITHTYSKVDACKKEKEYSK